ncbi:UreD-domain-containing protein [Amniculicola lignicola CBS 123094]|uniref:UreD-domain-containing protein n=1 Tax=Amniculicola lignicola CBS 123094 TaxID=1392246 RepID=A0A6A5W9Q6_9PLEO|nr:UreD-domain-containing protein [Amniculicola lignicola CBS 123094]
MASYTSPFAPSTSKPGHGSIRIALLPPNTPVLRDVSYQYPLKLVAPDPLSPPESSPDDKSASANRHVAPSLIHTIFLLTYGGGIVAGDAINLNIRLDKGTRLILLTQGSTKIFKTADPKLVSRQKMSAHLQVGSALCYLPDPVQPFASTAFAQEQIYTLEDGGGNLCVCDWVTSGRSARGENWDIYTYHSRNEIWESPSKSNGKKKLLLRDNLILDKNGQTALGIVARMDGYAVFGTLIIHGPIFASLARFFMVEFEALPRIGGRNWGDDTIVPELSQREKWRKEREKREREDGLIWSAANVRGFVLVKFGSRDVEGARNWLRDMVKEEGSVGRMFGERAGMCLK